MTHRSPMFAIVAEMNIAFGNAQGVAHHLLPHAPDGSPQPQPLHDGAWERLQKQCDNIGGKLTVESLDGQHNGIINGEVLELLRAIKRRDLDGTRDALCDIMVFALGAFHIAGLDADADMQAVIDGVMTRFCRNEAELDQTVEKYAKLGITKVYTVGAFPTLALKVAEDQVGTNGEQFPKGKFLKSVSYRDTVFPPLPPSPVTTRRFMGMGLAGKDE